MPITMSDAKVSQTGRETLTATVVNNEVTGGNYAFEGVDIAGITEGFLTEFNTGVDDYADAINTSIDSLATTEVTTTFKGTQVEAAINNFITAVGEVAKSYVTKLQQAEKDIAAAVEKTYSEQDTTIVSDLQKDADSIISDNASSEAE